MENVHPEGQKTRVGVYERKVHVEEILEVLETSIIIENQSSIFPPYS